MRISYSIMLLVAAVTQINAAATPYSASKCILNPSKGEGQGDGFKNYCCADQSDCIDDCIKGVCNGPVGTATVVPPAPTSTGTPGTCVPGSFGLGKGDGYKNACCKDQSDCQDDCIKGVCNGPVGTATVAPPAPTSTGTPGTCTPGSFGLSKGDGYKGACCKDQSDCQDDCKKGVCNGPVNTKTTTKPVDTATVVPPTPTGTPGTCVPGSFGLGKGDGYKDACCKDQSDCQDDCIKGVCNGPVGTATVAPPAPTSTGTPGTCTPGSFGLGKGDGYKNACCKDQSDCQDDCKKGVCNGPINTKTTTKPVDTATVTPPTPTGTPGTCTTGSFGLGKGDGYKGACCKDQSDCQDDCIKGVCNGPVNTKTNTATSAPAPTPGACKAGFSGKKNGKGGDNACCKTSDDCQESCLNGRCGLA